MNKFLSVLLIFISIPAFGGLPPTSVQGQSDTSAKTKFAFQVPFNQMTDLGGIKALLETGNLNLLANPSFEHTSFFTGWNIAKTSGTSFGSGLETTEIAAGKQALRITATAAYGTVDQSVTPAVHTASQNFEAACRVYASSGTGVPQICALSSGSEVQCVNVPVTSSWQNVSVNFPAPANGSSAGVRFKTTVADSTSYYVDDCYVGPARNLASGYMATDWTAYTATFSAASGGLNGGSTPTQTGYYRRVGDSMEVYASLQAGGSGIAAGTGDYSISIPSGFTIDTTKVSSNGEQALGSYELLDIGSTRYVGSVIYASTTTIKMAYNVGGYIGSGVPTASWFNAAGDSMSVHFTVPVVGWTSSQAAYKADVTPSSWMGTSSLTGTTASGSYADFGGISGAITTTTSRTLTCSAAASQVGVTCTLPRAGNYQVCWSGAVNSTAAPHGVAVKMVDGSGTVVVGEQSGTVGGVSYGLPAGSCGNYLASAVGSVTFKLQGHTDGTGTMGVFPGSFSVVELDAPMPAPYLIGSVTSGSTSGLHTGMAKISGGTADTNCTSSCTVNSQNGDTWVSSVTRSGTGAYSVNFTAGYFSSAPICVCSSSNAGVQVTQCGPAAESTSSVSVSLYAGASATDGFFRIQCSGPR